MSGPLIGRQTEVATLEGFVQRVRDGPACLVLIGEPGIGKTALWERAVEHLGHVDDCVLVHRAVEAEAALSFTGLADLITPVFEDGSASLPGPQRRALEVALLLSEPSRDEPADQRAVGVALLNLLKALADRGPVVLAIDDLHWLDPSTAAVLGVALRRLRAEPIGLLATVRQAPGIDVPLDLDRSFTDERLQKLLVGPFSLADLDRLLRERLGLQLTRPELTRLWESARGNPYFALELGRELARTGRPDVGSNLRPTERLRDLLLRRLASLPEATLDVLVFGSALAQPSVELIGHAYGGVERALPSLEEARRRALIDFSDGRVRFAHPLLASVCYEKASPWRRRTVHRRLAQVVKDPEERARHLALGSDGPDEGVASDLEIAAQRAAIRGATSAGAELAELSVRLTPLRNERSYRRRSMQAAALHYRSGDLERANTVLEQLLRDIPHGVERADVLYGLATNGRANVRAVALMCREALAEAGSDNARCAEILSWLSMPLWRMGAIPAALESARAGLERAERTNDKRLLAVTLARAGAMEDASLDLTPGLLERGMEIEQGLDARLVFHESPKFQYAGVMLHRDQLDRSRKVLEEVDAAAAAAGDEVTRQWVALNLTPLEWYAGRWDRAQEQADMALELAQQTQYQQHQSFLERYRALLEADLGLFAEARHASEEGIRIARLISDEVSLLSSIGSLGRIELLAGNLHAAGTHLRDLPSRALSAGWLGPDSVDMWPDSIETLIRLGDLRRAQTYLETFEQLAPRASRRWVAGAARCHGLLAAVERDFKAAFDDLNRALSELETVGYYPLDRGRTLLVLGSARRLAGQKAPARAALEEALTIFNDLGARAWSAWAVAELGRISGRRPPSHELTETELRVATLASRGLSNVEIASALFMGVSTVEAHLSRVYGKLGVRRAELARHLRDVRTNHQ